MGGPKSSKWTVSIKIVDDRKIRNKSSWIEMDGSKKDKHGEIKIVLIHLEGVSALWVRDPNLGCTQG